MRLRTETLPAGVLMALTLAALIGFGGASSAPAQPPPPPAEPAPAVQPAKPTDPVETPAPSKVFPEGGFPDTPPAAEGGIPAATTKPGPVAFPWLRLPGADYAPPGLYPREMQEGPGVPEFFRPTAAPLPDYFYQ